MLYAQSRRSAEWPPRGFFNCATKLNSVTSLLRRIFNFSTFPLAFSRKPVNLDFKSSAKLCRT